MSQPLLPASRDKTKQLAEPHRSTSEATTSFQGGANPILQLQRTLGNQRVAQLIRAKRVTPEGKIIGLQPKLTVGAADDQYEQEADRIARQVVSMPDPLTAQPVQQAPQPQVEGEASEAPVVQSKSLPLAASITPVVQRKTEPTELKAEEEKDSEDEKEELLQAQFLDKSTALPLQRLTAEEEKPETSLVRSAEYLSNSFEAGEKVEARLNQSKGQGSPLPDHVRSYMEPRFGVDFSHVRIHTGSNAIQMNRDVGAQAFTHGSDIYYGAGSSPGNMELTAHELTHVLQQEGGELQRAQMQVKEEADKSPTQLKRKKKHLNVPSTSIQRQDSLPDHLACRAIPRSPDEFQQHDSDGRRLLAHKLAHVGQGNDAASTDRVKRQPTRPSDTGQQQGGQTGQQATLDPTSRDSLAQAGLVTSAADESELATGFPDGFTVGPPTPAVLSLDFGNRLDGVRVQVFRLTPARTPQPGVEAWFFHLDQRGRSILVSSIGGGSVLFDAGSGQSTSINARAVQRLVSAIGAVTSGSTAVPQKMKLSHDDVDHYNAARPVLTRAGFSDTAVEVTRQQIEGAGPWTRSSLTVQPGQRLIEVDVVGTSGVHVRSEVIDNMELTEFRSVAAHSDLGRTDRITFNRNRTSPVVVVRDLNTGHRMVFTGDAEGRQFDEIVNAVGDIGMRRLLGAEGRNLRLMEVPHHFGEQAGPDARGMINMLQLAYESGEGSLRLVAQTTENFSTKPSSTFNFLDASGMAPERILGDPSGPGQAQATRAQGSTMATITVDLAGVQQAIEHLQSRDTPLRQANARLAELEVMQARIAAMRTGIVGPAAAPVTSSLDTSEADVARLRASLSAATQAVWDAMRTAAAPRGMRNTVDMTAVDAALGQVASRLTTTEADASRVGNGIGALAEGLSTYARLSTNSVRIIQALEVDNVGELYAARAEHNDLVRAARAELGGSVVDAHIRAAWKAVQAQWPVEEFEARTAEMSARVAGRERSAEFRAVLGEGLARQYELNRIVAAAEHAGRTVYGPGGTPITPMSTRVGAGVMAAIEVVRIGLDLYALYRAASDAAELREARTAYQGIAIMNWWERVGVTPTLALAEQSSWNNSKLNIVLRTPQDKVRQAAVSDSPPEGVPDFTAVVVTGLNADGLRNLIHRAIAELSTLEDWYAFTTGLPGGEAFKAFPGFIWGVRVFLEEQQTYGYVPVDEIAPGLNQEIIRLHGELVEAQENAFAADQQQGKAGYEVRDTAWIFGQDRRVVIYTRSGNPRTIDFDSDRPRFQKVANVNYPWRVEGPMVKVKAADMMTYSKLVDYFWVEASGQLYADETGTHEHMDVGPNVHGYAYVDPDNLIQRDV